MGDNPKKVPKALTKENSLAWPGVFRGFNTKKSIAQIHQTFEHEAGGQTGLSAIFHNTGQRPIEALRDVFATHSCRWDRDKGSQWTTNGLPLLCDTLTYDPASYALSGHLNL